MILPTKDDPLFNNNRHLYSELLKYELEKNELLA